ncbi:MAG: hypothetical protein GTO51_03190 [Candidatus Latescibacteria bacterium]|nr:hypothetical protein [Candidatus Latescibacterota bacterium]NIM22690.1 hypothetical protein [Candidatus Latescibacterota bacterium]NIM64979.1 hypothetical protein [Candidatus Latescibacterota bacterium]NIO01494.1 hypothetical protein [Candidatus Latescibacterota bacterium]NIO28004.1 hypothetical protein [Candidatus Latescibacterota bacterium]
MKIRIGKIPYLNSEVFFHGLAETGGIELIPLVPSKLSQAAIEGTIDAGPVPLVTCFDTEDRYKSLGNFCIATTNKARSILLFSKLPVEELNGAAIGITSETSTSVRLLKVLLLQKCGIHPRSYASTGETNDAFLLIGDEAIRRRKGVKHYPHVYDLGGMWHEWTRLPFVFARWIVRRDLPEDVVERVTRDLQQALEMGLSNVSAIAERRGKYLKMTEKEVREYIDGFRYVMDESEMEAVERFKAFDVVAQKIDKIYRTVQSDE